MSNKIKFRKLNRTSSHRKALMRNLTCSLVEHETIKTTLPKAKEMRSFVEKLITKSKVNDFNSVRYLKAALNCKETVKKLLNVVGPRNKDRPGGYVRVLKAGHRAGDNAPMAYIQLVEQGE
ncbi:50S ribosomal protein L17 [Candidatus Synchoanobacter obligatus]|uniref:Large ribosomal subunit protein bL17 n=1 Tax=Candidatus Synchoanobacter obligatus TaxID=2919597 RepID=A0ABT1L5R5_9GAMM|nr:50S ribosomal protein L17 [Candidatus Synchoanobacter obligatus]MCP8352511.1 50S ribosomal protein L17 [Candidatus Synchoanobacter obligatus]